MADVAPWLLGLATLPLYLAFAWGHGLASVGDDSVSYLVLARWMSGNADAVLLPLVPWHAHFPPLFPLALALAGGGVSLPASHVVVALFAALSTALIARFAALRLGGVVVGLAIAVAFLALPTAWVSIRAILSESLYLAVTLAALVYHERCVAAGRWRAGPALVMGLLLAAVLLTRSAGVAFVAAFLACRVIALLRGGDRSGAPWLALLPPILLALAWAAIRPGGQQAYDVALTRTVSSWIDAPARSLEIAMVSFSGGWLASFLSDSGAQAPTRVLLFAFGLVAAAGTARAVLLNRLDGWYVLGAFILLFMLPYGENNSRRMLYPLVPILLVHAAEFLWWATSSMPARARRLAVAAAFALPLLPSIPSVALVARKAADREPFVAGSRYVPSDLVEYFATVNLAQARASAARHAAVLGGLERLATDTPPSARIMWMRPEYVALLGQRAGAASYFDWDARRLAREVREARIDFLVVSGVFKSDLRQNAGDPAVMLRDAAPYTSRRLVLGNPYTGFDEFILLEVDRAALDAFLAARPG